MIVHLASFVWKAGTTDDEVAGVTAALWDMARVVPELKFYLCGANLHLRPAGADFAVLALLEDQEALDAYLDGEAHAAVQRDWLSKMVESRQAAQLRSDALEVSPSWVRDH